MILVCGEALFDLFAENGEGDRLTLDARIGGSPFNVAVGGWPGWRRRSPISAGCRAISSAAN